MSVEREGKGERGRWDGSGRRQPCDCALVFPGAKMGHNKAGTAAQARVPWEEEEANGWVPPIGEKEREKGKRAAAATMLGRRPAHAGRREGEGATLRAKRRG